jgi:hypothetical protein
VPGKNSILLPSEAKNRFSKGSAIGQLKANQVRAGRSKMLINEHYGV